MTERGTPGGVSRKEGQCSLLSRLKWCALQGGAALGLPDARDVTPGTPRGATRPASVGHLRARMPRPTGPPSLAPGLLLRLALSAEHWDNLRRPRRCAIADFVRFIPLFDGPLDWARVTLGQAHQARAPAPAHPCWRRCAAHHATAWSGPSIASPTACSPSGGGYLRAGTLARDDWLARSGVALCKGSMQRHTPRAPGIAPPDQPTAHR